MQDFLVPDNSNGKIYSLSRLSTSVTLAPEGELVSLDSPYNESIVLISLLNNIRIAYVGTQTKSFDAL